MFGVSVSANRIAEALTWLGGGEWRELGERHERSTHVIAGIVVLLGTALALLVATLAITEATNVSIAVVVPLTLVFGLLVGAVSRAIASGPTRRRSGIAGRTAVAVVVGVVVGELAAVVLFSGPIDGVLDERAVRSAAAVPAVVAASADLDRAREARTALDTAVNDANRQRDEALVVARCEFNPSPACPQTHITGVPGAGPETRTATDFLADTQRQLDNAVANRDRTAPGLAAAIAARQQVLEQARTSAMKDVEHGLGARWMTMNDHTLTSVGALLLRLLTIAFFALLVLLPLILKLWRGQTSHDRGAAARAEIERAELEADTAIAVKRAEVRATVETLWAEQQLASARLAIEAQTEIDREQQRRLVVEALEAPAPVQAQSEWVTEPTPELPSAESDNLPALAGGDAVEPHREGASLIPTIPDVTKVAARWLRPFVPPIIASAIDTTTKPLRGARQVFEETEEIHFSLRRTHKVSVQSEEHGPAAKEPVEPPPAPVSAVSSVERQQLMTESGGQPELRGADGPRQLPSAD
jgi:peptidoglycan hydrolase-like protein with peptidoglycan-binding domain